ncbi:hypothetical protein V9T40_004092 [Parthenolecanium corni]|uniref:Uncharacterized protein n=1 Tax=Parthenolecanium corni TaxID=536013 RepID=A0AAN9TIC1_9HEMI
METRYTTVSAVEDPATTTAAAAAAAAFFTNFDTSAAPNEAITRAAKYESPIKITNTKSFTARCTSGAGYY